MTYKIWAGIDGSINHAGWCVIWRNENELKILDSGVHKFNSRMKDRRYGLMSEQFIQDLAVWPERYPGECICISEKPTFQCCEAGLILARKKHLPILTAACAIGFGLSYALGYDTAYITPSQWKRGSKGMSNEDMKRLILNQVQKIFPHKTGSWKTFDEVEAVAIALWAMMRFNQSIYEIFTRREEGGK